MYSYTGKLTIPILTLPQPGCPECPICTPRVDAAVWVSGELCPRRVGENFSVAGLEIHRFRHGARFRQDHVLQFPYRYTGARDDFRRGYRAYHSIYM